MRADLEASLPWGQPLMALGESQNASNSGGLTALPIALNCCTHTTPARKTAPKRAARPRFLVQ